MTAFETATLAFWLSLNGWVGTAMLFVLRPKWLATFPLRRRLWLTGTCLYSLWFLCAISMIIRLPDTAAALPGPYLLPNGLFAS